jgi:hypothetical protein
VSELYAAGVPGDAIAGSMFAALHGRGQATVERLLRENDSRWESLSATDRRTVEALLLAVVSRLLDRPSAHVEPGHVELLRELFALAGAAGGDGPA